jgi:hypothetical protein
MSLGEPVATVVLDDRVKAKGKVRLGRQLELRQEAVASPPAGGGFVVGRPAGGFIPAVDDPFAGMTSGTLSAQRLEYSLAMTSGELFIEDDGLTTSYGIFGAPRTGKTHLLMYLLRQLLDLKSKKPEKRFGGLILDPKAALIADIRTVVAEAGRSDDFVVINIDDLEREGRSVNPIDARFDPYELGRMLVLAAQSAGAAASEPFWFAAWSNLFGAAVYLHDWLDSKVLTLRTLVDSVLLVESADASGASERPIQRLARQGRQQLDSLDDTRRQDAERAINQIEQFYRQEPENIETVNTLITRAYSGFQQSRFSRYSPPVLKVGERTTFYDQIIDEGKIVLVSVSPTDPGMAKTLCTLIKCLFQVTVLGRRSRVLEGSLHNYERPLVLAIDEYSQVASEVPGEPMGDGHFFSLARQNGCMGLVVTQSVNVLQASSLKENWRSVFSNFGAKIFMRLADNETTEEATKLIGETDWYLTSRGSSHSGDGMGSSTNTDLRDRKFPSSVFTQLLERRQACIVGSLDGNDSQPSTYFVRVPDQDDPETDDTTPATSLGALEYAEHPQRPDA